MKKYDYREIQRLPRNHFRGPKKVFQGKNPVRLYIHICHFRAGRRFSAYKYNGKWSYAAIKAALRIHRKLVDAEVHVVEYLRNAAIYAGGLQQGQFWPSRLGIIFDPDAEAFPFHPDGRGYFGLYQAKPLSLIKVDGASVYVVTSKLPAVDDRQGWLLLRKHIRLVRRRGDW